MQQTKRHSLSVGYLKGNYMTSNIDTLRKRLLSVVIITILGLQTGPIITQPMPEHYWGDKYWPFTNYPMYNRGRAEGDYVNVGNTIIATLDNGEQLTFSNKNPGKLGINFWNFFELCTNLLRPVGHNYVAKFTSLHPLGDQMVKLEIYNYPVIVTRDGPKEAEQKLMKTIVINPQTKGEKQ
jgi:hypothetical protein